MQARNLFTFYFFLVALLFAMNGTLAAQDLLWAKGFGGASRDLGNGVAFDDSGNVYISWALGETVVGTGEAQEPPKIIYDAFVAKYDSNGELQWSKPVAWGPGSVGPAGIALDGSGDIYLVGFFKDGNASFSDSETLQNQGDYDAYVAKYDNDGDLIWVRQIGGTGNNQAYDVAVDGAGHSCVVGFFTQPMELGDELLFAAGYDAFVAKYDEDGDLLWAQSIGGLGLDHGYSVAADASSNCYVGGEFSEIVDFGGGQILEARGDTDVFVAKYDHVGNIQWAVSGGGDGESIREAAKSISVDEYGNVHVAGFFFSSAIFNTRGNLAILGPIGSYNIFVAKYDADGELQWAKSAGGSFYDVALGITSDRSGNGYVAGCFTSRAFFGDETVNSAGSCDIFVAKYDRDGEFLWARSAGGAGFDGGLSVGLDRMDDIYVTGLFQTMAVFDLGEENPTTLLAFGETDNSDGFLVKLEGICGENKLDCILAKIHDLYISGEINKGQANSLTNKIEKVKDRLEEGKDKTAINMLNAFINQVEAFVRAGIIPAGEGQWLINTANAVIVEINGS